MVLGNLNSNQLVTTICQPTQTTFRTSRCSKECSNNNSSSSSSNNANSAKVFQNGSAPNPIPQQILHQGKVLSSQSSNDSNWSFSNTQRIAILQLTQQQKNHERCNYKNLAHKLIMAMQHNYCVFSVNNVDIPYFIIYPPADFNINEPIDDGATHHCIGLPQLVTLK